MHVRAHIPTHIVRLYKTTSCRLPAEPESLGCAACTMPGRARRLMTRARQPSEPTSEDHQGDPTKMVLSSRQLFCVLFSHESILHHYETRCWASLVAFPLTFAAPYSTGITSRSMSGPQPPSTPSMTIVLLVPLFSWALTTLLPVPLPVGRKAILEGAPPLTETSA